MGSMKILVTGGAGFIGSHVVDAFVKGGHEVGVIDDLSTGVKDNINPKSKFWQGSVIDADFVGKVINEFRPEILNHHAAHIHVGRSVEDPIFDATVNIDGTIILMQAALKVKTLKKVIFASTGGAMYGNKQTPFHEEMMPAPLSPYGVSKRAAELYLLFYEHLYRIPFVGLRYANVYGPRQNPHGEAGVVSIFARNFLKEKQPIINGDGKQTRDYVHVDDVVKANLLALTTQSSGVFNIGTGIETNVNTIFQMVREEFGADFKEVHGPPRTGEQERSSLSYNKAKDELLWQPHIVLKEGIKMAVEWFRSNPERV